MPGEPPDDQARIKALTEESKVLEEELIEVEAKNRLYTLLGERTRSASKLLQCQSPGQVPVRIAVLAKGCHLVRSYYYFGHQLIFLS